MSSADPHAEAGPRVLLAAGTQTYDSGEFARLEQVPLSLRLVFDALAGVGFVPVIGPPGYLLDPGAEQLKDEIDRVRDSGAPVIVVYYTGHGERAEGGHYYVVARDSTHSPPRGLRRSAVPATDFAELLTRRDEYGELRGDQPTVLVILDCCYSGSAGMEMLGEALRGIGNPNVWIIASAGALEYAQQGLFAEAFCDGLRRPTTGLSQRYVSLESIVGGVNEALADHVEQLARVFAPATGSTGLTPPFFPNPSYLPGLAGLTVADQYWVSRARGGPEESTAGFYLTGKTGRLRAAERLAGWMTEPGPGGLAVVTGSPGAGKSAVLALPVLLASRSRRGELLKAAEPGSLIERTATLISTDTPVTAINARGLNTDQVAIAIASVLGREGGSGSTLLENLDDTPLEGGQVVIVDGVDEAYSPDTLLTSLLFPLARKPGLRVAVGARRHVLSGLAGTPLIIDLDSPAYQDPQALAGYIDRLLLASEEPGITTPYQDGKEDAAAAVAEAIAQRATSRDRRTESFLIGRVLALSVRGRTEPVDITSPGWQSELPAELTEAFDQDLGRLGEKMSLARILLEALAWAKGPGLPWENIWVPVARALANQNDGYDEHLITDEDVRWLLDKAGAYVVEDRGPGERSVYRPFHEMLAAYLRGEPPTTGQASVDHSTVQAWQLKRARTEQIIVDALLAAVPTGLHGLDWDSAHPYLRTYLVQHADIAGPESFKDLVRDRGFLTVADQVTLSPYPGMRPYGPEDAAFFYGREEAVAQVLERMSQRLEADGILMVSGAPGVGVSSLLRAGVLPGIRAAGLPSVPGSASWPALLITPGPAPLDELAARVAVLAGIDLAAVRRALAADPAGFAIAARRALVREGGWTGNSEGPGPGQQRLLLVVDQFEELFVLCPNEAQRRMFITALRAAATSEPGTDNPPAALVVLGVRADFVAHCAAYPELVGAVQDVYRVMPMTERQLRRAITEPAKRAGIVTEAGLVDVVLHDASTFSGASRLLQFALYQAWSSHEGDVLTLADYERTGGIQAAAARLAELVYDSLTPSQQAAARVLFTRLVAISSDGVGRAQRARHAELTDAKTAAETWDLNAVLQAFTANGLLTLDADTVGIPYEVLPEAWPRLREWIAKAKPTRLRRSLRKFAPVHRIWPSKTAGPNDDYM